MPIIGRVGARISFAGSPYTAEYGTLGGLYTGTEQHREMLEVLRVYYLSNGVYDTLRAALYAIGADKDELRPLRNPANRVVEFYAAKLWPGAMPLVASDGVKAALDAVWAWSNWAARKQVLARWQALYGNVFIKVDGESGRPELELVDPRYVVDFERDERGFVTYIRMDIPQTDVDEQGRTKRYIYTEIWDKAAGTYTTYHHTRAWGASEAQLGNPVASMTLDEFGIDFVPVVWIPLRDIGEKWAMGAFQFALDKIDEANRQCTRMHAILFRNNKALWALSANAQDKAGRPLPPPKLANENSSNEVDLSGEQILRLPGMASLNSLVPSLDYGSALAVVNAMMLELEQDLPEMAYYRLMQEKPNLSGRALQLLLGHAVDRVVEARQNAETGLIRAQEMALTMGQALKAPGFSVREIRTWESGRFAHSFAVRPVFPLGIDERAEILAKLVQAGVPLEIAMKNVGYTDDEIAEALNARARERMASLNEATAYLNTQRGL